MDTLMIPGELEFRQWIKDAVKECLDEYLAKSQKAETQDILLSRKEASVLLKVSLVTLTDWMKRGLPFHKQRGRVYFLKSEVMAHIKAQRFGIMKFKNVFQPSET